MVGGPSVAEGGTSSSTVEFGEAEVDWIKRLFFIIPCSWKEMLI